MSNFLKEKNNTSYQKKIETTNPHNKLKVRNPDNWKQQIEATWMTYPEKSKQEIHTTNRNPAIVKQQIETRQIEAKIETNRNPDKSQLIETILIPKHIETN